MKELEVNDNELKLLVEGIFLRYNYDFRHYSMASIRRRIANALIRFRIPTVSSLLERVLREPDFFSSMLQYLTISTTEMFRDPKYFESLRERVFPHLTTYPSLKFWIAGCSTGEEVYSFAILLDEANLLERSLIYATDINPVSLRTAQLGIYGVEQMKKYTLNYQKSGGTRAFSDYYSSAYDAAEMLPHLKKNLVFADHSLATDSVFCEVQMVSCRNVLIYFDRALQDRAIDLFCGSLSHRGFLGLGEKESLRFSTSASEFEAFHAEEKIYRRIK